MTGETNDSTESMCDATISGSPGFPHQHVCELSPEHKGRHTCGCGTEWA